MEGLEIALYFYRRVVEGPVGSVCSDIMRHSIENTLQLSWLLEKKFRQGNWESSGSINLTLPWTHV